MQKKETQDDFISFAKIAIDDKFKALCDIVTNTKSIGVVIHQNKQAIGVLNVKQFITKTLEKDFDREVLNKRSIGSVIMEWSDDKDVIAEFNKEKLPNLVLLQPETFKNFLILVADPVVYECTGRDKHQNLVYGDGYCSTCPAPLVVKK